MNQKQFRRFYDAHYGLVYYWLLSKLRHREAAQDVAAQSFMKAWTHRNQIEDPAKHKAWIIQIANHEMCRHWADVKRRRQVALEEADSVKDSRDFSQELEVYLEAQRVMNAATLLRAVSRRAIANAIKGIPQQGTAGSRLFTARKELKELCAA